MRALNACPGKNHPLSYQFWLRVASPALDPIDSKQKRGEPPFLRAYPGRWFPVLGSIPYATHYFQLTASIREFLLNLQPHWEKRLEFIISVSNVHRVS